MSKPEIYCPLCAWRPKGTDLWQCTRPGCGTRWHTFWTRGVCPGCGYQWRNTACYACREMSPHESWYHFPDPADSPLSEAEVEIELEHVLSR
jgi:hypothetical protein